MWAGGAGAVGARHWTGIRWTWRSRLQGAGVVASMEEQPDWLLLGAALHRGAGRDGAGGAIARGLF